MAGNVKGGIMKIQYGSYGNSSFINISCEDDDDRSVIYFLFRMIKKMYKALYDEDMNEELTGDI